MNMKLIKSSSFEEPFNHGVDSGLKGNVVVDGSGGYFLCFLTREGKCFQQSCRFPVVFDATPLGNVVHFNVKSNTYFLVYVIVQQGHLGLYYECA